MLITFEMEIVFVETRELIKRFCEITLVLN